MSKVPLTILILFMLGAGAFFIFPKESPEEVAKTPSIRDTTDLKEPIHETKNLHEDEILTEETQPPLGETIDTPSPTQRISDYLDSYTLSDPIYGTETQVVVSGGTRTITTNALPNHEHGTFPNQGNPNAIRPQQNTYTFPLTPTFTGIAEDVRIPGVGINGVPFEPGTAERVTCASGETYRLVGLQDTINLGMDMNNAHVQPTGQYHYHGTPEELITFADQDIDLVHIGFARDGHHMYFSKSGAYTPSYTLSTTPRTGSNCRMTGPNTPTVSIAGTQPDGTYEEDWVHDPSYGTLDTCNGTIIDGDYAYIVTDTYPFVSRCLMGVFQEETRPQGDPGHPPGGPRRR